MLRSSFVNSLALEISCKVLNSWDRVLLPLNGLVGLAHIEAYVYISIGFLYSNQGIDPASRCVYFLDYTKFLKFPQLFIHLLTTTKWNSAYRLC